MPLNIDNLIISMMSAHTYDEISIGTNYNENVYTFVVYYENNKISKIFDKYKKTNTTIFYHPANKSSDFHSQVESWVYMFTNHINH